MRKHLPIGDFKWMDEKELQNWRNFVGTRGCILEVDLLEYPKELHDLHNDYPCAPQRVMVGYPMVEKLIPTLEDKKRYILHCENLKLYESLGMKVTKIHSGISFTQRDWFKPYIDLNTRLRAEAKNDFEKGFLKLLNNLVFGKTMENTLKCVDIRLVSRGEKGEKKAKKLAAKPSFEGCTILDENLVAMHMHKTSLGFYKPLYIGMCILELSKTLMYDFHYGYIKPKYGHKAELLFTDTDSLAFLPISQKMLMRDSTPPTWKPIPKA